MPAGTHLLSFSFPGLVALRKPWLNKQIYSICVTSCITLAWDFPALKAETETCVEGWVDMDNVWCAQHGNPSIMLVAWTSSRDCHFLLHLIRWVQSIIVLLLLRKREDRSQDKTHSCGLCSCQLQHQQRSTRVPVCWATWVPCNCGSFSYVIVWLQL